MHYSHYFFLFFMFELRAPTQLSHHTLLFRSWDPFWMLKDAILWFVIILRLVGFRPRYLVIILMKEISYQLDGAYCDIVNIIYDMWENSFLFFFYKRITLLECQWFFILYFYLFEDYTNKSILSSFLKLQLQVKFVWKFDKFYMHSFHATALYSEFILVCYSVYNHLVIFL